MTETEKPLNDVEANVIKGAIKFHLKLDRALGLTSPNHRWPKWLADVFVRQTNEAIERAQTLEREQEVS